MAEKEKINYANLPRGLSKKEFTELSYFKKIRSFFTWAGAVSIVSGLFNFSTVGQLAEYEARGYAVNTRYMGMVGFFAIVFIIMGILLIRKKTTIIAYIVAVSNLIFTVFCLASGGRVGVGIVALIFSLIGAIQIDKKWKLYQSQSGPISQGASMNQGFVSAGGINDSQYLKQALQAYRNNLGVMTETDLLHVVEVLKKSRVWIPYQQGMNQPDILSKDNKLYFPIFSSQQELGEYGRQFLIQEKSYFEWLALAKGSKKPISGIVVNAFTDSVILTWNLFDYVEGRNYENTAETTYTR